MSLLDDRQYSNSNNLGRRLVESGDAMARTEKARPELFFPAAGFLGLAIYGLGSNNALSPGIFMGITYAVCGIICLVYL